MPRPGVERRLRFRVGGAKHLDLVADCIDHLTKVGCGKRPHRLRGCHKALDGAALGLNIGDPLGDDGRVRSRRPIYATSLLHPVSNGVCAGTLFVSTSGRDNYVQ
jgi:hypothetical protein